MWWLNPCWPLAIMLLGTGVSAYIIPYADYVENWKTPKYLGAGDLEYIFLCVAGFVLSACFINVVSKRFTPSFTGNIKGNPRIPWPVLWFVFYACFVLSVLAYAIWFAMSMAHGLSISDILSAMRNDQGAIYTIRDKTDTLPGVTTLTQLEMGVVLLGTVLGFKFGWKKHARQLLVPLLIIFGLAFLRAHFREERTALLEIVIPLAILALGLAETSRWRASWRWFLALLPLAAPVVLYVFFAAAEYSRSWVNFYQDQGDSSFLWFSFTRLAGYYVTALNNGAAYVQSIGHYPVPYYSLEWLWKFPVIKDVFSYQTISGADPSADYEDILMQKLNPELNNPSGVFLVELDYGFIGGIVTWSILGIIAMFLYRSFLKGSLTGLLLYPFFYIGLLESPRILYWSDTRTLPTWLMLFALIGISAFTVVGDWRKRRSSHSIWEALLRARQEVPGLAGYRRAVRRGL